MIKLVNVYSGIPSNRNKSKISFETSFIDFIVVNQDLHSIRVQMLNN